MDKWRFVRITESEIDRIVEIDRESFVHPWSKASFRGELDCIYSHGWAIQLMTAGQSDPIIGYIYFRVIESEMHILKIAVIPEHRRNGFAARLMEKSFDTAIEKGAEACYLEVRVSNSEAIHFYQRQGFRLIAKRPNYYSETSEDAWIMMKDLKEVFYDYKAGHQRIRSNRTTRL